MRTLILSGDTGEGHNSCAKAIEEYYISQGEICKIEEGLQFISPSFSRVISGSHTFIYKYLPWLFRWGYNNTERHPNIFRENALVYRMLAVGTERLYQYINENEYDRVICTHVFAALILSNVIKKYKVNLVTGLVLTDYTCYPGVKDCCLNYYFIPGKLLRNEFERADIAPEKIISSGIPVRRMFYEARDRKITDVCSSKSANTKKLLLMCGSMGCGPITVLLEKLIAVRNENWDITVVCGKNERLRRKLEKKYNRDKHIHIRGYVQNMAWLMGQADLYITKPGGISVTEAAVEALPMLLFNTVAGCEEYNRTYFVANGGARTGENLGELVETCSLLMNDEESLNSMHFHLKKLHEFDSAQIIFEKMQEG